MKLRFLILSVAMAVSSPAQTSTSADFNTFGSACRGTTPGRGGAGQIGLAYNTTALPSSLSLSATSGYTYALTFRAPLSQSISGFQLLVRTWQGQSPVSMPAFLYLCDSSGKPTGNAVRTGIVSIPSQSGSASGAWVTVTFGKPFVLPMYHQYAAIGFTAPTTVVYPWMTSGPQSFYYHYKTKTTAAWQRTNKAHYPGLRILCGENACLSCNTDARTTYGNLAVNAFWLVRLQAETDTAVSGFELLLKSSYANSTVTGLYRADAAGRPIEPAVRYGRMRFTTRAAWQTTRFDKPYTFKTGERFFIGFANPTPSLQPLSTGETPHTFFYRPFIASAFYGPFTSKDWAFKVHKDQTYGASLNASELFTSTVQAWKQSNYYFPFTPDKDTRVTGFEMLLNWKGSLHDIALDAWLLDSGSANLPGTLLARTTMVCGLGDSWCRARFGVPVSCSKNRTYYVGFCSPSLQGLGGPASAGSKTVHYRRDSSQLIKMDPAAWCYRIMEDQSNQPSSPAICHTNYPVLGGLFAVSIAFAPPRAPVVLLAGASRTKFGTLSLPLHLNIVNAPGCSLRVSPDFVIPATVDSAGNGTFGFFLPNNPALSGSRAYLQWACSDPSANGMGLVLTNGSEAVLGR